MGCLKAVFCCLNEKKKKRMEISVLFVSWKNFVYTQVAKWLAAFPTINRMPNFGSFQIFPSCNDS
ncbi:hypothetical protein P170DRAFT_28770 [Aspergillus steynii IBT 23096]|uniref:Uncharacterized protein n=1 Tax=Aspergillus steynii IBT 23096 TaxID=1392250 RepID=A0A2I2GQ28_9EURO|nr:uncharacterized protein P170DRAFT_28770 [Aspergillus steynii IBT 23096]PLB54970.1 hypothetical protein P170DRAFT_28770 [Aspergillus steynii IBT 23096]